MLQFVTPGGARQAPLTVLAALTTLNRSEKETQLQKEM